MMFFDGWQDLARMLVIGVAAYVMLIVFLLVSGKRTLSKMNSFDFVITIALGSTLATVLLSRNVSLSEGALAFALLIFLQFAITWLSVRSALVRKLVKDEPRLLFHHGQFLERALHESRVTHEEILQAARSRGIAALDQVDAIVLETDGSISIIREDANATHSTLANVRRDN